MDIVRNDIGSELSETFHDIELGTVDGRVLPFGDIGGLDPKRTPNAGRLLDLRAAFEETVAGGKPPVSSNGPRRIRPSFLIALNFKNPFSTFTASDDT
jgi:hypothetical protein